MKPIIKNCIFGLLLIVTGLTGCTTTATLKEYDGSLILYKQNLNQSEIFNSDEKVSFLVEGDKKFSGRPSSVLGAIFVLDLDLERMQKECAIKVIGSDNLEFDQKNMSELSMTSSIKDFRWVFKNVGWIGQTAKVSFVLDIMIKNSSKTLYKETFDIKDYYLEEAAYKQYSDLYLSPAFTTKSRSEKLAFAAFLTTTKVVCEKYRDSLNSI